MSQEIDFLADFGQNETTLTFVEVLASIHESNLNHGVVNGSLLLASLPMVAVFIARCDSQNADFVLVGVSLD